MENIFSLLYSQDQEDNRKDQEDYLKDVSDSMLLSQA